MDSVGELMQQAREKVGVTVEQAARDTLISRRYIEALESEAFSVLPGETYVAGFIRNYSSYLDLDPDDMISLYRNLRIQEQPTPIKELLETDGRLRGGLLFAAAGALAVAAAALLVYWFALRPPPKDQANGEEPATAPVVPIALVEELTVRSFAIGSIIEVPVGGRSVALVLEAFDGDLLATYPTGEVRLRVGSERLLDLDGDDRPDLRVLVRAADTSQVPPQVQLRLGLRSSSEGQPTEVDQSPPAASAAAGATATAAAAAAVANAENGNADGTSRAPVRAVAVPHVVARSVAVRMPFAIDLSFRGNCLLRYTVDEGAALQRFFESGERISIDVVATATLWLSNAGRVTARFAGSEVRLGNNGAVAAKVVEWVAGEPGERLIVRTLF